MNSVIHISRINFSWKLKSSKRDIENMDKKRFKIRIRRRIKMHASMNPSFWFNINGYFLFIKFLFFLHFSSSLFLIKRREKKRNLSNYVQFNSYFHFPKYIFTFVLILFHFHITFATPAHRHSAAHLHLYEVKPGWAVSEEEERRPYNTT